MLFVATALSTAALKPLEPLLRFAALRLNVLAALRLPLPAMSHRLDFKKFTLANLLRIVYICISNKGEYKMAQNDYIDIGQEQDCHNDVNVMTNIKGRILEVINECRALSDKGAMAYNEDLPERVHDALDNVLAEVVQPVENMADEGILFYESNRHADA